MTGSHADFAATELSDRFGVVTDEILTGRKYVVVRAISGNPVSNIEHAILLSSCGNSSHQGEKTSEAQRRIIREFYDTVEDVPTQ